MTDLAAKVLSGAVAAGFVLASGGGFALAADKVTWNFNMFGPKRALTAGIESLKEDLEAAGGGKFELVIHYGGALGPEKQNPENVMSGVFEAAQICAGYYPNKYPLMGVMELPFLMPADLETRAKIEMEFLQHPAIVAELKDRWNSVFFGPSFLPAYEFMGNKRIQSVADMKGVKMRISGLNATVLQDFGATPTMVTAPEGYQALDRGTIDMFGFPYSYAFGSYKMYEVSKFSTEGFGMSGFMCFQTVNQDAWKKTPDAVKAALPKAQEKAIAAMVEAYREADAKWIPIFKERLEIVQFPAAERDKLVAGSQKYWTEWAKEKDAQKMPGTEILEFAKNLVAKHTKKM